MGEKLSTHGAEKTHKEREKEEHTKENELKNYVERIKFELLAVSKVQRKEFDIVEQIKVKVIVVLSDILPIITLRNGWPESTPLPIQPCNSSFSPPSHLATHPSIHPSMHSSMPPSIHKLLNKIVGWMVGY